MNIESELQVSILVKRRNVYEPDPPPVSTSAINITTMFFYVVSYQPIYLTGRRTGNNETKAYPTIYTYLPIALTGDTLKEKTKTKEGYSQSELENLSRIRNVRNSLKTRRSAHMAKERTCCALKSELLKGGTPQLSQQPRF